MPGETGRPLPPQSSSEDARALNLIAMLALAGCTSTPELAKYDAVCSATYPIPYSGAWRQCRLAMYHAELSRSTVTQSTTVIQER